jgi:hypothetical protein
MLRGRLAPLGAPLAPFVLHRRRLVAAGLRLLARLDVGYRNSAVSVEGAPPRRRSPRPGERLADAAVRCDGRELRLHDLTARPGVHVLLDRDAPGPPIGGPLVHLHRIESRPGHGVVAVRPDGHVGFTGADAADPRFLGWLRRVGAGSQPGNAPASRDRSRREASTA